MKGAWLADRIRPTAYTVEGIQKPVDFVSQSWHDAWQRGTKNIKTSSKTETAHRYVSVKLASQLNMQEHAKEHGHANTDAAGQVLSEGEGLSIITESAWAKAPDGNLHLPPSPPQLGGCGVAKPC